jgi:hypothetical protein
MKHVPNSITVIGAAISLVVAIAMCSSSEAAKRWKLDCESKASFTWKGTATDASGKLLEPGDYPLKYCYYECNTLIGCCETKTIVTDKGVASAVIAMAQPIWEDTIKIDGDKAYCGVWFEVFINGVLVSRSDMTAVAVSAVGELSSVKEDVRQSVQRIEQLEKQLEELQAFRKDVTATMKKLSERLQAQPLPDKGTRK